MIGLAAAAAAFAAPLPEGAVLLGSQAFYAGDRPSSAAWTEAGPAAWSGGRLRTFDPVDGRVVRDEAAGRPHWLDGGGRLEVLDETHVRWADRVYDLGAVPFDAALLPDGSAAVTVARAAPVVVEGPDGVVLRLGRDGAVRELVRVRGDLLIPLDVSGDRVASGTLGGRLLTWTLDARGAAVPGLDLPAHTNGVLAVAWLADGRLLTGGADDRVTVRAADGRVLAESTGYGGRLSSLVVSPDGRRFVAVGPMEARVRRVDDGAKVAELGTYRCAGTSAAWSPDGTLVAVTCGEGDLGVFDPTTGEGRLPDRPRDGVCSLAWSPDGALVAVGSFGRVDVFDARSGARAARLDGHRYRVEGLAFEGDALVASSEDARTEHGVAGWTLRRAEAFAVLPYVRPSPPDLVVAEARAALGDHPPPGAPLARGGDRVALARGAEVVVWSVAERRELAVLRGHRGAVTIARFAADGRLATGSADGTVVVWPAP